MMYNNKFVVVIKHNNKICREHGDTVYLPFGSEYEIGLKNLHTTNAVVNITIDGQDVLDGNSLVVAPNMDTTIEGFMSGNVVRNRFKFIRKTKRIEQYRGNRIDDGIVRVEFRFEKPQIYYGYSFTSLDRNLYEMNSYEVHNTCCRENIKCSSCVVDDGITVRGSETHVDYDYTTVGALEPETHSIVLVLKGRTWKATVKRPLTVKSKLICSTCGKLNKSNHKYCIECGTYLL